MVQVAIVGAGAVGCTVAAWLSCKEAIDVALCLRTPFNRLEVETPDGQLSSTPRRWMEPASTSPVDWVFLAIKTYDAQGARVWLEKLLKPSTRVAILQNGVEHYDRYPSLDRARLVPVIVDIPAERIAPGQVRQRRAGRMTVPDGALSDEFRRLFDGTALEVMLTDDWLTAAWRKLAVNCAGAVNALTLKPSGIAHRAEVAELMRELVRECIAVGRAEGAQLPDGLADDVVEGYRCSPADSINSIHADRLVGRETEADARNGVIWRLARKHGLGAPLNHMADVLLRTS